MLKLEYEYKNLIPKIKKATITTCILIILNLHTFYNSKRFILAYYDTLDYYLLQTDTLIGHTKYLKIEMHKLHYEYKKLIPKIKKVQLKLASSSY